MKRILIIGVLFFLGKFSYAQSLNQDSCATKNLTTGEIAAYNALLIFTEAQIHCTYQQQDIENCWKQFLRSESFNRSTGSIKIPWTLKAQSSFIGKINIAEVTDSIWTKTWILDPVTTDSVNYYHLNIYGSLGTLLAGAAKNDETWNDIWQDIQSTGEIGPALFSGLFHPEVNKLLYDPKMRLLLSLELMRLNKN